MTLDLQSLCDELDAAHRDRRTDVTTPTSRDPSFDVTAGYAAGSELRRRRVASGAKVVGRKVGYANKAMWRALKLDTLVWGPMYDDTVVFAADDAATLSLDGMAAPKIEPEIVFKLASPPPGELDAAGVLQHVEWLALGFEIIDCVYADWKFAPADFIADRGLHAALIVGSPLPVDQASIAGFVDQLAAFTVTLSRDGEVIATGAGRNSLRSPALCLAALAGAAAREEGEAPLATGELVSSGTLTESQPTAAGQTWIARVEGLALPGLTLRV